MRPHAPLDADPALLPGGESRLKWANLAARQRFEAIIEGVRGDSRWSERPTVAEAVLAALSDRSYLRRAARGPGNETMTPPSRLLAAAKDVVLSKGTHSPDGEYCFMEYVSVVSKLPWSDHPKNVSPVIGRMARSLNDNMSQAFRDRMVALVPKVVGTAGDRKDRRRSFIAADWACRVLAPMAIEARGWKVEAAKLRALDPVNDLANAYKARTAADAAYVAAADAAAEAAAAAAAYAGAADAAYAAEAAAAAAEAAAVAAAVAAADAAYAGAYDAAAADAARATVEKEAFRMLEAVIKGAGP